MIFRDHQNVKTFSGFFFSVIPHHRQGVFYACSQLVEVRARFCVVCSGKVLSQVLSFNIQNSSTKISLIQYFHVTGCIIKLNLNFTGQPTKLQLEDQIFIFSGLFADYLMLPTIFGNLLETTNVLLLCFAIEAELVSESIQFLYFLNISM